jgi:hypothetical protein
MMTLIHKIPPNLPLQREELPLFGKEGRGEIFRCPREFDFETLNNEVDNVPFPQFPDPILSWSFSPLVGRGKISWRRIHHRNNRTFLNWLETPENQVKNFNRWCRLPSLIEVWILHIATAAEVPSGTLWTCLTDTEVEGRS